MVHVKNGGSQRQSSVISRNTPSPSRGSSSFAGRPKSAVFSSPPGPLSPGSHGRTQSFSPLSGVSLTPLTINRQRSGSNRTNYQQNNTFAPQFIKIEEPQRTDGKMKGIEGENDFSGKRYVWLRDPEKAFVMGWVVEETGDSQLLVQCDDGSVCFLLT